MFNIHKCISKFLNEVYGHPVGQEAQRLESLSCFVQGILKKGSCDLEILAGQMPAKTEFSSRVKRLKDWLKSNHNGWHVRYLPFLSPFLAQLIAHQEELVFILDGSEMGDGCTTLMLSLVYQKRSIPIFWLVKKAKKGHLPQKMHLELLKQLHLLNQTQSELKLKRVVILGDGEFDGGELTKACQDWGWIFVVRTAHNTQLSETLLETRLDLNAPSKTGEAASELFAFNKLRQIAYDKGEEDGHFWAIMPNVYYTEQQYGTVNAIFWHDKNYEKPLYLLSNLELAFDAYDYYKKRFAIETLFGDLKSRGFNIHLSKIGDPLRLQRLLIPVCIAFLITWSTALAEGQMEIKKNIMHKHKNDLSIFQIGRKIWDAAMNQIINIVLSVSMNFKVMRI